jgi:hypothetical protein
MPTWTERLVVTCLAYLCVAAPAVGWHSMNFSGGVGYGERLAAVTGAVVRLSKPDDFAGATVQREVVVLKGVFFSSELGRYPDREHNEFVILDWFQKSAHADLQGAVGEVYIDGRRIDLLNYSYTNSLATKDYGAIPIAFTSGGEAPGSNAIYRCALAFSEEQLAILRKPGPPVAEQADAPSK